VAPSAQWSVYANATTDGGGLTSPSQFHFLYDCLGWDLRTNHPLSVFTGITVYCGGQVLSKSNQGLVARLCFAANNKNVQTGAFQSQAVGQTY
jgi:hypothetical protein